jgi:hypothetical protein
MLEMMERRREVRIEIGREEASWKVVERKEKMRMSWVSAREEGRRIEVREQREVREEEVRLMR